MRPFAGGRGAGQAAGRAPVQRRAVRAVQASRRHVGRWRRRSSAGADAAGGGRCGARRRRQRRRPGGSAGAAAAAAAAPRAGCAPEAEHRAVRGCGGGCIHGGRPAAAAQRSSRWRLHPAAACADPAASGRAAGPAAARTRSPGIWLATSVRPMSTSGIRASGSSAGSPRALSGRPGPRPSVVVQVHVADRRYRPGDRRQVDRHDAGGVGRRPAQHVLGIGHRVVVAQDRGHHLRLVAQVEPAAAQVARRGQRRVEHVLHVGLAVAVAVGGVPRPGARQELHRTHRAGVDDPARRCGSAR